jgi:hypothetical protein
LIVERGLALEPLARDFFFKFFGYALNLEEEVTKSLEAEIDKIVGATLKLKMKKQSKLPNLLDISSRRTIVNHKKLIKDYFMHVLKTKDENAKFAVVV